MWSLIDALPWWAKVLLVLVAVAFIRVAIGIFVLAWLVKSFTRK